MDWENEGTPCSRLKGETQGSKVTGEVEKLEDGSHIGEIEKRKED